MLGAEVLHRLGNLRNALFLPVVALEADLGRDEGFVAQADTLENFAEMGFGGPVGRRGVDDLAAAIEKGAHGFYMGGKLRVADWGFDDSPSAHADNRQLLA